MNKWLKYLLIVLLFVSVIAAIVYLYLSPKNEQSKKAMEATSQTESSLINQLENQTPTPSPQPLVTPEPGSVNLSEFGVVSKESDSVKFTYQRPGESFDVSLAFDSESQCDFGDGLVTCSEENVQNGQYNLDAVSENGVALVRQLVFIQE